MSEPMTDERLAEIRQNAPRYYRVSDAVDELLAEVDRLRAELAAAWECANTAGESRDEVSRLHDESAIMGAELRRLRLLTASREQLMAYSLTPEEYDWLACRIRETTEPHLVSAQPLAPVADPHTMPTTGPGSGDGPMPAEGQFVRQQYSHQPQPGTPLGINEKGELVPWPPIAIPPGAFDWGGYSPETGLIPKERPTVSELGPDVTITITGVFDPLVPGADMSEFVKSMLNDNGQ